MGGVNLRTIGYGLTFGAIDATALPIVKAVSKGWNQAWMLVPALLYGFAPFLLLSALREETLTIMNLVWDLTSDITVTIIGLFVFGEVLSPVKTLGVAVSFVGLILMSYESDTMNNFISHNYQNIRDTFYSENSKRPTPPST
jgi:multidrug transporter EmrE-like cation transporter